MTRRIVEPMMRKNVERLAAAAESRAGQHVGR